MPQTLKDFMAIVLAILAGFFAIFLMIKGESQVVLPEGATDIMRARQDMLTGLMVYFKGMGLAFLVAGMAYILVGQEEQLSTVLNPPETAKK